MTDRIEDAAKAMTNLPGEPPRCIEAERFDHNQKRCAACEAVTRWHLAVSDARIVAPILTADLSAEVQRLRGERDELQERIAAVSQGLADGAPVELLLRFTASAFDWNLEETQRAAKMLLKRFYPEATEAVERHRASLASLRASHAEVIRVVREWQEARKALKGKPVARPFADSALVKNLRDAEAALAAFKEGDT